MFWLLLAPHEIGLSRRVPPQVVNRRYLVRDNFVWGHCEFDPSTLKGVAGRQKRQEDKVICTQDKESREMINQSPDTDPEAKKVDLFDTIIHET